MKKKYRIAGASLALVLVLGAAGAFWQSSRGVKVEKTRALRQTVEDIYTEEGVIRWGEDYQVAVQASGAVKALWVAENSVVKQGDLLLELDSTDYEYEKELAESQLAGYEALMEQTRINQVMTASPQEYLDTLKQQLVTAEAAYQAAKSVYEADQALYQAGDIARVQLESAQVEYENALFVWQQANGRYEESRRFLDSLKNEGIDENSINARFYDSELNQLTAQIEAAKTRILQLEEKIGDCRVKADRDGRVISFSVKNLSAVQEGDVVAVISGYQEPMVEVDVLTTAAPYIREGDTAEVTLRLRGRDEVYTAIIREVYNYADKGTSALGLEEYRVHVKALLEDSVAGFPEGRNGYGVTVKFCLYNAKDCLTVPSGAVFENDRQHYVYQIVRGKAVKIPVELEYQTGQVAVVSSGLADGDLVIDQVDSEGIYEGAKVY